MKELKAASHSPAARAVAPRRLRATSAVAAADARSACAARRTLRGRPAARAPSQLVARAAARARPGAAAAAAAATGAAAARAAPRRRPRRSRRARPPRRRVVYFPSCLDAHPRPAARARTRAPTAQAMLRRARAGPGFDVALSRTASRALLRDAVREQGLLRRGARRGRAARRRRSGRRPRAAADCRWSPTPRPARARSPTLAVGDPARSEAARLADPRLPGVLGRARSCRGRPRSAAAPGHRRAASHLHAREGGRAAGPAARGARARARCVVLPPGAECCGFAGDRGFLVPELTASATAREAAEVRGLLDGAPGRRPLLDLPHLRDRHVARGRPPVPVARPSRARGRSRGA